MVNTGSQIAFGIPGKGNQPAIVHTNLMIVSLDYSSNPTKAVYFNNEGDTINYTISFNTRFEMSQDREKVTTDIERKNAKVK